MDAQLVASLATAGIAALAVAVSAMTTMASLRTQRENTKATVDAQLEVARQQDHALRERTHSQALRDRRVPLYGAVLAWAHQLLAALGDLSRESQELTLEQWHVPRVLEDEIDLFASDRVHVRFSALRAILIGITRDSGFDTSPLVTWTEADGVIVAAEEGRTERLADWSARAEVRRQAMTKAFDLITSMRSEMQGVESSGFTFIYRLDRPAQQL